MTGERRGVGDGCSSGGGEGREAGRRGEEGMNFG